MIGVPEIREALGWAGSRDPEVKAMRDAVVSLWESTTGLLWSYRSGYVEEIRTTTPRTRTILLRLKPVASVAQVRVRTLTGGVGGEWTTLEATDYTQVGARRLVRIRSGWDPFAPMGSTGWEELAEVTYTGGTTTAAADIRAALVVQARFMAERFHPDRVALATVSNPTGGSTSYLGANLHPMFAALAKRYGRVA